MSGLGPLFGEDPSAPVYQATVNVNPVAAPRPRGSVRGRGVSMRARVYTPSEYETYLDRLRAHVYMPPEYETYLDRLRVWFAAGHRGPVLLVPLRMELEVRFAAPREATRWVSVRKHRMRNPYPVCVRPEDVDNLAKTVMDALQPSVIMDDRLIVELLVRKAYTQGVEVPGYTVRLWEVIGV